MVKSIFERIYADFFMPSRLPEYEGILRKALGRKYKICSIEQFLNILQGSNYNPETKYFVLRHDIDTDLTTAREMFEIEKNLSVKASYYFRLSTLDIQLMQTLKDYGSEASYHYEEIATYAKKNCVRDPKQIYSNMRVIQDLFARNLEKLRTITELSMNIVASHGDFVNRYLQIPNHTLLDDKEFRKKHGIDLEVYDPEIMDLVSSRHSDTLFPHFWKPDSPLKAIDSDSSVIYLLTHPRHWQVNIKENLKDNIRRFKEGFSYNY